MKKKKQCKTDNTTKKSRSVQATFESEPKQENVY